MATDAASLLSQANCFACYGNSPATLKLMQLSLWAQLIGSTSSVWTDSISQSSIAGGFQLFNANNSFSMPITLSAGGSATAIRMFLGNVGYNGDSLKVALYTAGGNLLAQGQATINIADSNTLKAVNLNSSVNVSSGNYLLACSINSQGVDTIRVNAVFGSEQTYNVTFASFPTAILSGGSALQNNFMIGLLVGQPGFSDAASLISSAKCFACFGPSRYQAKLMKLALLVQLVTGNLMATDAASLLSQASCFACYGSNELTLELMELALLVQLVGGGGVGGGSGLQCGNYAGGQPTFTPATGCGNAIDTSNGTIWWYYNGAWH